MATRDDVRRICSVLPGAVGGEGGFGVEVKGKVKGFCWVWNERVELKKPKVPNPEVLAVVTPGVAAKDVILASGPGWAVHDPHYDGYPAVLVRLAAVEAGELEDLLVEAWRTKAPPALVREFDAVPKDGDSL